MVGGHDLLAVLVHAKDHVVLHAHADVAAQGQGREHDGQVTLAHAEGGPGGTGGDVVHQVEQVLHGGGHTAQHTQAELVVAGVGQVALLHKVVGDAQHTGVKNLDLRLGALLHVQVAQLLEELGGVDEHAARHPVEGTGVVGAHLNTGQFLVVGHTLLVGGGMLGRGAGGGAVNDDVTVLVAADQADGLTELLLVHSAQAVVGTHMQVDHSGTQLPGVIGLVGDLLGGLGDLVARGGDRAGQRGGNDGLCHFSSTPFYDSAPDLGCGYGKKRPEAAPSSLLDQNS